MKWKEITVETSEEGIEIVLARFDMLGITQVSIVQGQNEIEGLLRANEKTWDYAEDAALNTRPAVKAYFSEAGPDEEMERLVRESVSQLDAMRNDIGLDIGSLKVEVKTVDEEDWANNWKAYFKPFNIGERLLVCPSWEKVPETETRKVLRIDPGMAFGTGTHNTTRMCLELIEKTLKKGDTVADLGCGSGILSIAASLLGAERTDAVDIDPVAVRVALENAEINGVDPEKYFAMVGDILADKAFEQRFTNAKYDIVLANIVANVIIAFAPVIPRMLKKGGALIASGIIDDRLDEVAKSLTDGGLEIKEVVAGDDWRAILAIKP
ncbi:MAG: 50S ribosomal protein L11 methyltransferase [Clostridia bacterium]|nr:50S ribosomal protein L11 methyltransferase [Clostridia bacterium]